MADLPLRDFGVVITRPVAQARQLEEMIRAQGGTPITFPLLAIAGLENYQACDAVIATLGDCDWIIFISTNAVQNGLPRILEQFPTLPPRLRFAAIGPATAAEIRQFVPTQVLTPDERFDSETFLAMPQMQHVDGQHVVIVRGVSGRELLAETLRQRGAKVEFAECYRRINPQSNAGDLPHLWQNRQMQAIVVTSTEAMRHLIALGSGNPWLQDTPIFVNHARIAQLAESCGLKVVLAPKPGDEAMLQCLIQYQQDHTRHD